MDISKLTDPRFHASGDIHRLLAAMRRDGGVHRHAPGTYPTFWSITRHDDVAKIYRNSESFSSAFGVLLRRRELGSDPAGGSALAVTDPPAHRDLRLLFSKHLSGRAVSAHRAFMKRNSTQLVEKIKESGGADLAEVSGQLLSYLISRIVGFPPDSFQGLYRLTYSSFVNKRPLTSNPEYMRALISLLFKRMGAPRDDLMSSLVDGQVSGTLLTESAILMNLEHLVGATENAALSLTSGLAALVNHPDEMTRLRDDVTLMRPAVEEMIRWASSATHSMRTVVRPVAVGSHQLPIGARVVLWLPSANRDESVFEDPAAFRIDRQPNRHLALGAGPHVCVGGLLARLQLALFLKEFLTTIEHVSFAGAPRRVASVAVSGYESLPIAVR